MSTVRFSLKACILGATAFMVALGAFAWVNLALIARTQAAGPQVIITWRTVNGAAPADYKGKVLPTPGATITASVAVITATGKLADLSTQTIYWYLDDNFIGGGAGNQSITFNAPGHLEIAALRVNIPNFAGGTLINTAHIRVVNPMVAIIAPYPNQTFSGNSAEVKAFPYFFTTTDLQKLVYQWTVNGQVVPAGENPLDLVINLNGGAPAGYALAISFAAQKSGDPLAGAAANITLTQAGAGGTNQ